MITESPRPSKRSPSRSVTGGIVQRANYPALRVRAQAWARQTVLAGIVRLVQGRAGRKRLPIRRWPTALCAGSCRLFWWSPPDRGGCGWCLAPRPP